MDIAEELKKIYKKACKQKDIKPYKPIICLKPKPTNKLSEEIIADIRDEWL